MTITTDGILNVDVSGSTINVNTVSNTSGVVNNGYLIISTVSGGTRLPDVSVRQGFTFSRLATNGSVMYGGLSSPPYHDDGVIPPDNGTNAGDFFSGKVRNLNQIRAVASTSGYILGYFGVD